MNTVRILPLNDSPSFFLTLGTMLYPGDAEDERRKVRAFASWGVAEVLESFEAAGHRLSPETLRELLGHRRSPLDDLADRLERGKVAGYLLELLWALYNTDPKLTTWNQVFDAAETIAAKRKTRGAKTGFKRIKREFEPVIHLWGALSMRDWQFAHMPQIGYDQHSDFQFFLAEAEQLRQWGQKACPVRKGSRPYLSERLWQVPDGWKPPERKENWPETGQLPEPVISEKLVKHFRKPGRPPKAHNK